MQQFISYLRYIFRACLCYLTPTSPAHLSSFLPLTSLWSSCSIRTLTREPRDGVLANNERYITQFHQICTLMQENTVSPLTHIDAQCKRLNGWKRISCYRIEIECITMTSQNKNTLVHCFSGQHIPYYYLVGFHQRTGGPKLPPDHFPQRTALQVWRWKHEWQ